MQQIHYDNLLKLADYLDTLPVDYEHFNMSNYCINSETGFDPIEVAEVIHECGTIACLAGHGPMAGIAPEPTPVPESQGWLSYIKENFGVSEEEDDFLFSGRWWRVDNTHRGGAARIRYFLEHGIPDDLYTQRGFQHSYDEHKVEMAAVVKLYAPYLKED